MNAVDKAFALYGTSETVNWYTLAQHSQDVYRVWIEGLPLMAGVPKANQVTLSQFWRVLGHTSRMTNFHVAGVSEKLMNVLQSLTVHPSPALAGAMVNVADSWRHMDAAVWGILIFLNCEQTSDPQGCAANQR